MLKSVGSRHEIDSIVQIFYSLMFWITNIKSFLKNTKEKGSSVNNGAIFLFYGSLDNNYFMLVIAC